MKCMSCGNLIPDASTVCPYCNATLGPVVAAPVAPVAPEAPVQTTPVMNPVQTPVAPVAPEVPAMETPVVEVAPVAPVMPEAPVAPAEPVAPAAPVMDAPVMDTPAAPVVDGPAVNFGGPAMETPVVEPVVVQNPVVAPVVPETPVAPVLPQDQGMVTPEVASTPVVEPTPEVAPTPVAEPVAPIMAEPAPTTNMVAQGITPEGGFNGGIKEASTAPETKKKGKTKLIVLLVVLAVVVIAAVLGVLFYNSQYKSANDRLDVIVNTLFKDLAAMKNEKIDLASGKYNFEGSLSYDDVNYSAKLGGTYAYDIPNKLVDFTVDVKSVNLGEELFNEGELNLEFYLKDTRAYFLLQNFYEKYIYLDLDPSASTSFEEDKELEIDYNKLVIAVREATKAGLRNASKTQTIGDATFNGKTQKANVIEMNIDEANAKKIVKGFLTSLSNNKNFIAEIAKLNDMTEEEVKDSILEAIKDIDKVEEEETDEDEMFPEPKSTTNTKLTIYTAMFGEELIGARLTVDTKYDKKSEGYDAEYHKDSNGKLEIYPDGKVTVITLEADKKKVLEVRYEDLYEKTSTEEKTGADVKVTLNVEDKVMTFKVKSEITSDLQPKVNEVVTKESINANDLTEADITAIYNKAKEYGNFGMIIDSIFTSMQQPEVDPGLDYNDDFDYDYDSEFDSDYDTDFDTDFETDFEF